MVLEKLQRNYAAMVMFGPLILIDEHFLFSSFLLKQQHSDHLDMA